ncbi:hypothetical protein ACPOL_6624 [Acidisarcina polymorpha]|uniref:Uncharacterized protein n=1 Tax=Acidisarcina polymorpha TaxID=2211140 RepID=A0A2Z5GB32_9BACT|nr:hypothetical protein ACPOL_6624 [Acidisarcina polymorpha]
MIRKPALNSDIRDGQAGFRNQILSFINPTFDQPPIGWLSERLPEGPGEMTQ